MAIKRVTKFDTLYSHTSHGDIRFYVKDDYFVWVEPDGKSFISSDHSDTFVPFRIMGSGMPFSKAVEIAILKLPA